MDDSQIGETLLGLCQDEQPDLNTIRALLDSLCEEQRPIIINRIDTTPFQVTAQDDVIAHESS